MAIKPSLQRQSICEQRPNRAYNAHYGSKPNAVIGRRGDGTCDGSLVAQGVFFGRVAKSSTRLANAIINKECLEILGPISCDPRSGLINLPDATYCTLCADRDDKSEPPPVSYRTAMLDLLQSSSDTLKSGKSTDLLDHMDSIDIEKLLESSPPDYIARYLTVVRDIV
jgi:hypothetical protein